MAKIGERVRALRGKRGWTQQKLATLAGVDRGFLARIEGGSSGFSEETITRIAGALGVSLSTLYASPSNVTEAPADTRRIPVLDYVQAGRWTQVQPEMMEGEIREFIGTNLEYPPSTFALHIRGDSMEPRFRAGDIVIVSSLISPQPGDFVVAVDEEGAATFKQYRSVGIGEHGREVFELIPLNNLYAPMRSDRQHIAIVGTMLEHRSYRKR